MSQSTPIKIALVILTFKEAEALKVILPKLKNLPKNAVDEIFAVNRESTDGTREILEEFGIPVFDQPIPGRGEAMCFSAGLTDSNYLIFFSPDGNEDWNDIPKFRGYFEHGFDLVIASRMMKGARNEEDDQFFRFRKWANIAFNWLAYVLIGRGGPYITDTINGFRGIRKALIEELKLDAEGYTLENQMTLRSLKFKKKIVEFPTYEGDRIAGYSKAPSIPTGINFLKRLLKEVF